MVDYIDGKLLHNLNNSDYIFIKPKTKTEFFMKKLIFLLLIFFSYTLFPQSWEFIPQESILQFNDSYQDYGKLNIDEILIKGDSVVFVRVNTDSILMIYDKNQRVFYHILKKNFWKCLKNDSLYNIYKDLGINNLYYDSKENFWFSCGDSIIRVTPDTAFIYSNVFIRELNSTHKIRPANRTIRKIKEDKLGNIWIYLFALIKENDTTWSEYRMLCKYINNRIETIFTTKNFYQFSSKCNFVFDNQNRIWYVNGDTCYIIKDELVEKKFSTWETKDGYGYFSDLVIDSKDNFYATNNSMLLFKYNGDTLISDRRILDIERYITSIGNNYWLRIDSLDNLWVIGYETCNLYKIDKDGNLTTYEVPKVDTSAEVEWCYKALMEIDKNGKIWLPAQSMGKSYGIYIFNSDTNSTVVDEKIRHNTALMPDVWIYNIYPNPSDNLVTLDFFLENTVVDQLEVDIYNIMGMKIKDVTGQIDYDRSRMRANMKFSVAELPRGSYIVSVKAGKTSSYKLLLVGY